MSACRWPAWLPGSKAGRVRSGRRARLQSHPRWPVKRRNDGTAGVRVNGEEQQRPAMRWSSGGKRDVLAGAAWNARWFRPGRSLSWSQADSARDCSITRWVMPRRQLWPSGQSGTARSRAGRAASPTAAARARSGTATRHDTGSRESHRPRQKSYDPATGSAVGRQSPHQQPMQ